MAWCIVRQPNGLLARFSDIVDDFTAMNMTVGEAFDLCRQYLGIAGAKRKVRAGIEDWKPWMVEVAGGGTERWKDSLRRISGIPGDGIAAERRLMGETAK